MTTYQAHIDHVVLAHLGRHDRFGPRRPADRHAPPGDPGKREHPSAGLRILVGLGAAAALLAAVVTLSSPSSSPVDAATRPLAWEQERLATQVQGSPLLGKPSAWEQERLATQVRGTRPSPRPSAWEQERLATQVQGTSADHDQTTRGSQP